jgi:hypothetical protein
MEEVDGERRMHRRVRVEEEVLAALRQGFTRIGKVRDISPGGLSFEHVYEDPIPESLKGRVTILMDGVRVPDIPCQVVYDIPAPIPEEYSSFIIRLQPRRCGVKFEELNDEQKKRLEEFLAEKRKRETL